MIDYSLALLSASGNDVSDGGVQCSPTDPAPLCTQNGGRLYTLSIIDYLNDQSAFKKLESFGARLTTGQFKFRNYARKIEIFAKKICPTEAEKNFKELVRGLKPEALAKLDKNED